MSTSRRPQRVSPDHLRDRARNIRRSIVTMTGVARASHIEGALSVADILTVLYFGVLKIDPGRPGWSKRDCLILSKNHAAAALYATLAERRYISKKRLTSFHGFSAFEDFSGIVGDRFINCGIADIRKTRHCSNSPPQSCSPMASRSSLTRLPRIPLW